jgi:CubicO group peptidase (beta-lactamase class C family)
VYSDVGFILLTLLLERLHGKPLHVLWKELKTHLKIERSNLDFALDNTPYAQALPTETRHPAGQVNDDKAYVMGGVAGHAGLFGNLSAVQDWTRSVLLWAQTSPQVRDWLHSDRSKESTRFSWGWDTASGSLDSHAGPSAPKNTRGHLGYTGTALWIDPKSCRAALLLSNRVYPSHTLNSQKSIHTLRTWFFESFWQGKLVDGWEI